MKNLSPILLAALAFAAALAPHPAAAQTPSPTSLTLSVAPCDASFKCAPATSASTGQQLEITAHVVYSGAASSSGASAPAPTGALCIVVNGASANCGLTPVSDESWFTPSLPAGADTITATYAGDANYSASQSSAVTLTVGAAAPTPAPAPTPTPAPAPTPAPSPSPTPAPSQAPTVTSTSISVTLSDGFKG